MTDADNKIKTLDEVTEITQKLKQENKTTGLVTGCFDILHIGHIELFRFAKEHCDVLVVGLDNDETIRLSKGEDRPVNNLNRRLRFLSELTTVDIAFHFDHIIDFSTEGAERYYYKAIAKINPHYIFTNPAIDKFWRNKLRHTKSLGSELKTFDSGQPTSTTTIIQKIEAEW